MVVLAASICNKAGKVLVSRQFLDMPRPRIEGLLSSFPKLVPAGSQHTTVATEDVRFVYLPLEGLYLVLTTSLKSNIIQDIDTLQLFARAVADTCGNRFIDEREVCDRAFELLHVFDEIVSLGLRESITVAQLRSIIAMDSNEERIQEMITRNKELEAREQMRLKAKHAELERKALQRAGYSSVQSSSGVSGGSSAASSLLKPHSMTMSTSASAGAGNNNNNNNNNNNSGGGGSTMAGPVSILGSGRASSPQSTVEHILSSAQTFKPGMKLGASPMGASGFTADTFGSQSAASHMQALHAHAASGLSGGTASQLSMQHSSAVPPPVVVPSFNEPVHVVIEEKISATVSRDGGLQGMDVRGDCSIYANAGTGENARIKLNLPPPASGIQFKVHPGFDKDEWGQSTTLALREGRTFVPGQPFIAVRWRMSSTDEAVLPLTVSVWPTPLAGVSATFAVTVEYELQATEMSLLDVQIAVPLPMGLTSAQGSALALAAGGSGRDGYAAYDPMRRALVWTLQTVSEDNASGSIEFQACANEPAHFFPVTVSLSSQSSFCKISATEVFAADKITPLEFSAKTTLNSEDFKIV